MDKLFEDAFNYFMSLGYTEGAARYYAQLEVERQERGTIL